MYLSRIEITGFKSFAQKTKFDFSGGVSGVVGPNGCGKSNVVDAIRWVLGEQKSSVLRSDNMENVIFNGSRLRKPLGFAEVNMTIRNNKGILPTEYNEVNIARRLFRNGDSQYLLNKAKCRLRDITELFMDTGLGPDSYSVIELKMVEAILSGKVDERRHLFEEAAGVNKYKIRRREAIRKLNQVEENLTRVRDLVAEIEKNVNSLKRQAAKTRRYNKLHLELRDTEVALINHEHHHFSLVRENLEDLMSDLMNEREKIENGINELESSLKDINEKRNKINDDYQKARNREAELSDTISRKQKDIAVSSERIAALNSNRERLEREIKDAEEAVVRMSRQVKESSSRMNELSLELEKAADLLESKKSGREEIQRMVKNLRDQANELNSKVVNLDSNLKSINNSIRKSQDRKQQLEKKIYGSQEEVSNIRSQIDEINSDIEDVIEEADELAENQKEAESELNLGREKKKSLQNDMDRISRKILDHKNDLSQKQATLDFVSGLVDSAESSKFLLDDKNWQFDGEKTQLAEAVGADDKFLVAVDAALGEAVRYFVVDSREHAQAAFNLLAEKNKGKATFICRDDIPEFKPFTEIDNDDSVYGRISELVRCDDKLRNAVRAITGDMALVDDLEAAYKIVDEGKAVSAVTLAGEVVRSGGSVRGGALVNPESITVGKLERIESLKKSIADLRDNIKKSEDNYSDTKSEFDGIDLAALNAAVRDAEIALNNNQNRKSKLEYRGEMLESKIKDIEDSSAELQDEAADIEQEIDSGKAESDKTEDLLREVRENLLDKLEEVKNAEENLAEIDEEAREFELNYVRVKAERDNLERDMSRLENNIRSQERNASQKSSELKSGGHEIEKIGENIDKLHEELIVIERSADEVKNRSEYLYENLSGLQEQSEQMTGELYRQRKEREKTVNALHEKDIKFNEVCTKMQSLEERAAETYEQTLCTIGFEPLEEFSIDESRKIVRELHEKLKNIGPVNHRALADFDAESERLQFNLTQVQDLTEAEKNLNETIEEINRTAQAKFRETFDEIRNNFHKLFKTLFGGDGEGDIKLEEGDPLEADIKIMAKPPGKKPHSIEGISSGEKTLTAIALLFAIYLVKPSPFCILDEVDAPLDDANLGRFLNMIRDFSRNTQFLIVTHNKKTMESADTLYGITMQEDGVSKVVSVRLDRSIEEAA